MAVIDPKASNAEQFVCLFARGRGSSADVSTLVPPEQQSRVDAVGAGIEGVRLKRDARCAHQVFGGCWQKNADGEIHGASDN